MEHSILQSLFSILLLALAGGALARFLKLPTLVGYMIAGLVGGVILHSEIESIQSLAEIGIILLLFSVGLELSLGNLTKVGKIAVVGSVVQMLSVGLMSYLFLSFMGFGFNSALVLALGFSLSSTAVVVKMLEDRAESNTIHGEIMIGWLLVQDLAVVPMLAFLPSLALGIGGLALLQSTSIDLLSSGFLVVSVFFLGRLVAPFMVHALTQAGSRELIVLGGVALALGTAYFVNIFGVSAALGAFLAGVVISETQENHAIFAETRPLRDLFVILFFVTLGFFIIPSTLINNLPLILAISGFVIATKFLSIFIINYFFGYRGKTALSVSIGLAQVGEFSFILFLAAKELSILDATTASIGISTTLVTLVLTPFLFKSIIPLWRKLKKYKFFAQGIIKGTHTSLVDIENHIIVCGYGRMGSWIGKALSQCGVPFVVIEYNQKVFNKLKKEGAAVIYGDPAEPAVLEAAKIKNARAIVVAIPDRITEEEVVAYAQNTNKNLNIIVRAHLNKDVSKLSHMKVTKVIQPEFEGALTATREILRLLGRQPDFITANLTSLRRSHTKSV